MLIDRIRPSDISGWAASQEFDLKKRNLTHDEALRSPYLGFSDWPLNKVLPVSGNCMKYLCSFIVLAFLSCSNHRDNTSDAKELNAKDANRRLPGNFKSAVLYSYDSLHYYSKDIEYVQSTYGGDRMIDTSGVPPKRFFESYRIDSNVLTTVRSFFAETPCTDEIKKTNCAPIFRDAILFYDSLGKYVCQAQICFDCQKVSFYGKWEVDLCDFDNTADWNEMASFVKELKKD